MVGRLLCGASSRAGFVSVEPSFMHESSHWQASLDGHPHNVLMVVAQELRGNIFPVVVHCGRGEGSDQFAEVPCRDLASNDLRSPLVRGEGQQSKLLDELLHFLVKPLGFPGVGDGALPLCPSEVPPHWQQEETCNQRADMAFIFCPQGVPHTVAHKGSPQDGGDVWHFFASLVVGLEHHLSIHSIHLGVPDEVEDHSHDGLGLSMLHWPHLSDILERWQGLVPQDQRHPFNYKLAEAPESQFLLHLCHSLFPCLLRRTFFTKPDSKDLQEILLDGEWRWVLGEGLVAKV
ncbi:hypothetical protein NDU88_003795 [Pleurodeles waltl]|uniref:Uncharacterized protein n=1 Tax=Pleurodeles waltl TaxID=8319 RepID=A0AAV7MT95_PLEWA|nr:hypothetical protein NDU88_003795 [Pleurodeles waltl]